ncbi:hypothetical protein [Mycolicibacterium nivoides]|uniref:PPE family protein n=1 Tax=Mycolicibacterium nivoides TaxID=2487344 RepID=A0ABW9L7T5_9MYCO
MSSAAVELTAAVDPIAAWADLFTHTPESLLALGNLIAENPAPILGQIVTNWSGYGQTLGSALQTAGMGLSTYLTTTLPTSLQKFANQLVSGDMQGAADTFNSAFTGLATGVGFPMLNVFSIPVAITQNLANVVASFGPSFVGVVAGVGLSALFLVQAASLSVGDSAQPIVDAIKAGDPLGAFNALVAMPATVADGVLNGHEHDDGLFAGLLTVEHPVSPDAPPWDPTWPDGLVAKLLNSRLTIAKALGGEDPATAGALSRFFAPASEPTALPSASSVPDAASATSVTLSADPAPIEPTAKAAPTTDLASPPADSAAIETSGSTPTKEETVPLVRKSLVAVPGRADTLGATNKPAAKVASDVRDGISSTVNKIGEGVKKAFAKPEKKPASASTSSDKGSGSSSSSDSK